VTVGGTLPDFCPSDERGRVLLLAILALAAALRACHLLSLLPIMVDETIYLRWAEIIQHQHQLFISLLDGKTPLSFWLLAIARIWCGGDPLLSARLVSVASGTASTWILFATGNRLAGSVAGFASSTLYALLPYGLFYDRIAYTDTFVNLSGVMLAYVSLVALGTTKPGVRSGIAIGLTLGTAYLFKPTAGLLAAIPVGVAVGSHGRGWCFARKTLAVAGLVALAFPLACWLAVPNGPRSPDSHLLLHRTSFFTPLNVLIQNPLTNIPKNLELLWEYICAYVSVPLALAAVGCLLLPIRQRALTLSLFASGCVFPLAVQMLLLAWFPSRYVFPHVWPCVLAVGAATAEVRDCLRSARSKMCWLLPAGSVAIALAVHSAGFLSRPAAWMQSHDADEHLGSGNFSGVGIRPAIEFLETEASKGGFTLLTDPIWGPPADAMYSYLNGRHGIRVYDAWWMQLYDVYPILPREPKLVMKSQYERVADGLVDFPHLPRVFYVTATNYNRPAQVTVREPSARLLARFARPNGTEFIDVYRLR
jgi:4-amino-4-deoxy-L-arabinose transferase-like glycosyltransferase